MSSSAPHERSSHPPPGLTPAASTPQPGPTPATASSDPLERPLPGLTPGASELQALKKSKATVDKTGQKHLDLAARKGKGIAEELKNPRDSREDGPGCGAGPSRQPIAGASYRDAVVRPRTFKPRFPKASSHHGEGAWLQEVSKGQARGGVKTVRERLGAGSSSLIRRGAGSFSQRKEDTHLLALLRARAGARRCFNCLATDHRIAQCRDPPKCLCCSRSGHKARSCPRRGGPAARAFSGSAQGAEKNSEEEEGVMDPIDLEFPPGDTSMRPPVVLAGAPRTNAIREAERDLELHTLVAVQRDACVPLSCAAVLWDALRQLRIPEQEMSVEGLSKATFLLRFSSSAARNAALIVQEI
ncbi:unnamed protein product [Urochloa humidicola]